MNTLTATPGQPELVSRIQKLINTPGNRLTSSSLWLDEEQQDEASKAKGEFSFWLQGIEQNEKLFERHVYKNSNLSALDLHQHRARLFAMLAHGESLIVQFYSLGMDNKIDPANYFKLIEENLGKLLEVFNAWHGPLSAQDDIPDDFKEGIRDIEEGKVVELDKALSEKPSNGAKIRSN